MKITTINFQTSYKQGKKREKNAIIQETNRIRGEAKTIHNGEILKENEEKLRLMEDEANKF